MRQISFFLLLLLGLSACSSQYNIDGNSSLACLDGKKLYLRVPKTKGQSANGVNIDSCVVVHGRFSFGGTIDSIALAEIYVEDQHDLTTNCGNLTARPIDCSIMERLWRR